VSVLRGRRSPSTRRHAADSAAIDVVQGGTTVQGHVRTWTAVVPRQRPARPALLVVFHGSNQNAERMRRASGHGFDRVAGEQGVVVVYPNAYRGLWNDSRAAADSPARAEGIDDGALVEAVVTGFTASHGIDPARVFAAGFSNGGQLVFRLAAQLPGRFAGLAAIGATWPTPDNHLGPTPVEPVAMLLMNGTADPIVPFGGGVISLFGFKPRGTALSAPDTAHLFARLNGITAAPVVSQLPHRHGSGKTSVTLTSYLQQGHQPVLDYTVVGGGHVVPNPRHSALRILGRTTHDVDAPAAVWNFFSALQRRQGPTGDPLPTRYVGG